MHASKLHRVLENRRMKVAFRNYGGVLSILILLFFFLFLSFSSSFFFFFYFFLLLSSTLLSFLVNFWFLSMVSCSTIGQFIILRWNDKKHLSGFSIKSSQNATMNLLKMFKACIHGLSLHVFNVYNYHCS